MRKEFQAERLKMKRKHTFLLFAACYGLAAAWMLYAVTDLDFGRFNDFAALAAFNLLMIASIFSPVLIAAYASRLADVEQYGNCYKWIACLQTPASIWNAKALSGLSHILLYTLAQTLLLAAVCGYFREPSLSLYVQVFLDLLLTCAALFFLQLWLSICSKSQLVPLFVSIAGTFGGIFSALMLLFLGPQVAKVAAQLGTAEYFMVCVFGLTIIAGVSGKSIIRGLVSACLGLLISCIGTDPMTSYDRFTFGIPRLYLGLDLAVCLIGLFALVEILAKAEKKLGELRLDTAKMHDDGKISRQEYKRMVRPVIMSSIIGVLVGIIPGTGASEASWFSYNTAKNLSKHPEEFGNGSVEGIAAAESANNAVTGATLIPLLTLGIPGDGTVAIMLSALMINGLNPGLSLFTTDGDIMYAIMLGLILVNLFMFIQGRFLTTLFAKVVSIPQEILTPIIVIFCFAGAYSVNENYFDVAVALVFGILAWILRKLDLPPVPILLGLVLGRMTETNFRRALLISNGDPSIFLKSIYCKIFLALIIIAVGAIVRGKWKEQKAAKAAAAAQKESN